MRKLAFLIAILLVLGFVSSAQAINITLSDVENGRAVVQGGKAAANATITWEGGAVTKANKNGGFSFSGVVPSDCVGSLSDGVTTLNVTLTSCTVASSGIVPKTGQTTSYDANTPQRDDGALQKGVSLPTPRFTDNGNGTITDNLTGLIWLQIGNCGGLVVTWQQALSDIVQLNTNGLIFGSDCRDTSNAGSHQTDWRMPNVRELQSLIDYGHFNPAITTNPFGNFPQTGFWSSTTYAGDSSDAWVVFFQDGTLSAVPKTNTAPILVVRGGS